MKNLINNIIILGLLIFLIPGCGEEFLERNHPGDLTLDKLYKTEDDFNAALAGCYQSIMGPATTNVYLGEIPSDNAYVSRYQPSGSLPDMDKLVISAQNGELDSYWSNNYRTIQRINFLIDQISNADIEKNIRSLIVAEAKFLRAYSYFNLVRVFGGVPLYDRYVELQMMYDVPRAPVEDILDLIIKDLTESKNLDSYRASGELTSGRASTVAVKTLLGKVYLWKKDFSNAETTLADIVSNSGLELEDLSVLYDPDNSVNKEIIFSINYERTSGFSSPFINTLLPYNSPKGSIYPNIQEEVGSGYGMIEPYVAAKFSSNDKRAVYLIDTLIFENLGITDTNIFSRKYVDLLTTFNWLSGSNTIILRYADVLLMYAEALNENGKTEQAYQYINQVRNRAGIGNLSGGYSKNQMFQALADERQREFLMEGDRWFDLCYRGIDFLKQEMNAYIPHAYLEQNRNIQIRDHFILFPVPEQQIEIKPILEQNPGY
ncbi:MAG: RagB/SusD family nutrient uptake outer membrane protein [Mangrovibacterium sp.]